MRRGTTPTIRIKLNAPVTEYTCRMAIVDEEGHYITIEDDRLTKADTYVETILTQEETLTLTGRRIYAQLRAYDPNGLPITETGLMIDGLQDDIIGPNETETEG